MRPALSPLPSSLRLGWRSFSRILLFGMIVGSFAALPSVVVAQPIGITTDPIPHPKEDAALVEWLREQRDAIGDVRKVRSPDLPRIFQHVDSGVIGGEFHRAQFPKSPNRAEAIGLLARLLYLNVDRHVALADYQNKDEWGLNLSPIEIQAIRSEYQTRIFSLLDEALALSPTGTVLARLLETKGELQVRTRQPREAARSFRAAIAADPAGPTLDELYIKLAEAHINAVEYPLAEQVTMEALARFPSSKLWPHYFWFLHKVLRQQGKLDEALAAWEQILPRLEAGGRGEPMVAAGGFVVPEEYRVDYQRYARRAEFYRGFFLYAKGEVEEGQKAIQKFSDGVHEYIQSGGEVGMDTKAYLDFQANPMDHRISLLQGRVLPEFGEMMSWLNPPTEVSKSKKGKLRIFCGSQRAGARQRRTFDLLKQLGEEYSSRIQVEWVALALHEGGTLDRERAAVFKILEERQLYDWTIGVDVTGAGAHNQHAITTGGVTLVVSDAEGNFAWQLIDPMYWDEGLIRTVIRRLFPD